MARENHICMYIFQCVILLENVFIYSLRFKIEIEKYVSSQNYATNTKLVYEIETLAC